MLNFFNAGMVVAQGTVEEVKKDIPELEVAANKDNTAQVTEEESEHAEADDDLAEAEQLHEAVDDRKLGSVPFKVDAKYFMFGASVLVLLLILLIIVTGQGKINSVLMSSVQTYVSIVNSIVNSKLVSLFWTSGA